MEKEKLQRKRSIENRKESLPTPPPDPMAQLCTTFDVDPFRRLSTYRDRENMFLKLLTDSEDSTSPNKENIDSNAAFDAPNDFLILLNRTGSAVSSAMVTKDAVDQLDRLHILIKQFLTVQEQNMQMHRTLKTVETLCGLKNIQQQMKNDSSGFIEQSDDNDLLDYEFEQNFALLERMLATGNSASRKRTESKGVRQRSKSAIPDEIAEFHNKKSFDFHTLENSIITNNALTISSSGSRESTRNYPLRRQSAVTEFKPKVSKWTKVKAAFKWEKASALAPNHQIFKQNEISALVSNSNTEAARYLRVPIIPCVGSSVDSVLSSSSGVVLSGGSNPGTPGENSLGSSIEDIAAYNDGIEKLKNSNDTRNDSIKRNEDDRRSRSLDGDAVLTESSVSGISATGAKNKSAWSKVKGIVKTHRGSLKSNRSRGNKIIDSGGCSREASPCDYSAEANSNDLHFSDSFSSTQTTPSNKNATQSFLSLPTNTENTSCPNSPSGSMPTTFSSDDTDGKGDSKLNRSTSSSGSGRSSRKSRHIPEIESVPEGVPIDPVNSINKSRKSPPKPIILQQESGNESFETVPTPSSQKYRKLESSTPNSPLKAYEFFEFEPEDLSSGDVSEPPTPLRQTKNRETMAQQRDEIRKRNCELQRRLQQEFDVKQKEWDKMRPAALTLNSSPLFTMVHNQMKDDAPSSPKLLVQQPLTEENLSPEFKKKLSEWRSKNQSSKDYPCTSKESDPKRKNDKLDKPVTDWQLWKTGQIKLEGQGLKQLPDAKDLPEDFQKKLSEWKQMKAANKVPPFTGQPLMNDNALKRQMSKPGQSAKKSKSSDESSEKHKEKVEGLSKLKALVTTEVPKKEVVVQTTQGVIKFEGISRKFTRKLFEWEKAKGIGPEASTFAFLHPGNAPVVLGKGCEIYEKKREKSPALARSFSMDSISPNTSAPSVSHQPSSLSLNNADDFKDLNGKDARKISSNPELEVILTKIEKNEPEAVLVEIEDDNPEFPEIEISPGASFDQNKHETGQRTSDKILRNSTRLLEKISHDDHVDPKEIKLLKHVLRALIDTIPEFMRSQPDEQLAFLSSMKSIALDLYNMLHRLEDPQDENPSNVQRINCLISNLKDALHRYVQLVNSDNVPEISISPDMEAQAIPSIQRRDSYKNMATVNVTPTFICRAVKLDTFEPKLITCTSSEHIPCTSQSQDSSSFLTEILRRQESLEKEKEERKLTRNLSNGSRRKTRIRRMGSRQNSKTESDTDDDTASYVFEAPRKMKRKTSRAKKNQESQEKVQNDDIVYVLKIKPGQVDEESEKIGPNDDILISPKESCIELLECQQPTPTTSTNVIIKTKRKIFTTVEGGPNGSGNSSLAISQDVESSSTSDKNEPEIPCKIISNLPPLPQSPSTQRRLEQLRNNPKEISPNIRLMIAKYNQKLSSENNSPHSSGSCSPVAWRSPVLDRRVKKQTEKYQESIQLTKSASAGSLRKSSKSPNDVKEENQNVEVMKSSSFGALTFQVAQFDNIDETPHSEKPGPAKFLAFDSMRRKDSTPIVDSSNEDSTNGAVKKERLYKKKTDSPVSSNKGAIKKSSKYDKYARCKSVPIENLSLEENPSPLQMSLTLASQHSSQLNEEMFNAMSQRALKIKRAKEEFLRNPGIYVEPKEDSLTPPISTEKRMSTVSTLSTTSGDDSLMLKSASVGLLSSSSERGSQHELGYMSLPRESKKDNQQSNSRFGLSNLASKLRKVKLRRSSKDLSKMQTVSLLCRQSLMVDICTEGDSTVQHSEAERKSSNESDSAPVIKEPLKKSESVQAIKKAPGELKKSKSMGFLEGD